MINYKISIIIPTYNRLPLLKECLKGIFDQTYRNYEIIIIDDSDNDQTEKYIKQCNNNQIIYSHNIKNMGMGMNRRIGYGKSSGDIVLYIDDDDYYTDSHYFERLVKIFNNDNIDIVLSNTKIVYEGEGREVEYRLNLDKISVSDYLRGFMVKYRKPTSTLGFAARKECLNRSSFSDMTMMNDTPIYLRSLINANGMAYDDNIIGVYRMHTSNDTYNVKADFAIDNIKEKIFIYNCARKKFSLTKKWLDSQILVTAKHFAMGKESDNKEIRKVVDIVKENVSLIAYLYYRLFLLRYGK